MKNLTMKNWSFLLIMLLGSVFLFQSCNDDDDDNDLMGRQDFVNQATSSNLFEIAAGEQARDKGQHADVKEYGSQMIMDHTAAGTQMAALASAKRLNVPSEMSAKHREMLNNLSQKTGTDFDKTYADMMVQSHEEAINLFEDASKRVDDQDLKKFASDKLPTLREHLEHAEHLEDTVNP